MSIQSPARCEIRSVIRYLVWKGKTPVEVYNEVKTAYGDTGMNRTSVFKWCREFKNGRTSVHDDQRSGRPSILTDGIVKKIENALRDDRRLTVDELSAMFPQISRSLLHETITETLGYRKLSARWVPNQLTDQHKLNRVEAGQEFLRRYKLHGDEFLRSIVTGDETWVEKTGGPEGYQRSRRTVEEGKGRQGGPLFLPTILRLPRTHLLSVNQDTDAPLGCTRMQNRIRERRIRERYSSTLDQHRRTHPSCIFLQPVKQIKSSIFSTMDKKEFRAIVTAKLIELWYELLLHAPYSSDLASCNFFLFPNLKIWPERKKFASNEEVIVTANDYFAEFQSLYFLDCLKKLEHRWIKCINLKGDYIEK
ncbi:SETMR methyltransferase, partial [Pseudoatta argentina]